MEQGRPPYPNRDAPIEAIASWANTPPTARHLITWNSSEMQSLQLEEPLGSVTTIIQRFADGWLLSTGGRAELRDRSGRAQAYLDLGHAIEDIQTTRDGKIWVSYFDEGIFGSGIATNGLVCFNANMEPIFKYAEFAERNGLPHIDDCYAMNVVGEDEIWVSYYGDFPLVVLKNFELFRSWDGFGCMRAFAKLDDTLIFVKCYTPQGQSQLLSRTLSESPATETLEPIDEGGKPITGQFSAAARGSSFYLWTSEALYQLAAR